MVTTEVTATLFKALSDPTRLKILELLSSHELAVRSIAERFPVSRPAISRHLRVLLESSLVSERQEGRERVYALRAEPLVGLVERLSVLGRSGKALGPVAVKRVVPRRAVPSTEDWRCW